MTWLGRILSVSDFSLMILCLVATSLIPNKVDG
jgi:hypothetical protein